MRKISQQEAHIQFMSYLGNEYVIEDFSSYENTLSNIKIKHLVCGTTYDCSLKRVKRGAKCSNNDCLQKRKKKTFLEKYGVDHPWKSFSIREKTKQTLLKKYNVDNPMKDEKIKRKSINRLSNVNKISHFRKKIVNFENVKPLFGEKEYKGNYYPHEYQCNKCGYRFRWRINMKDPICRKCFPPMKGYSNQQNSLFQFIKKTEKDAIENVCIPGTRLQVDIFIPSKKVAFEYNGLYWHSELYKEKEYHLIKKQLCSRNGIDLYHIFSDEWKNKKDIVKSMILVKLKNAQKVLYARKCDIVEIDPNERKTFFDENHISGDIRNVKKCFGLSYKNEIVAAMSFRAPFTTKYKKSLEMARFAVLKYTSCIGAFSKLMKHSISWIRKNGYDKILSYADLRFGNGDVYSKNGFQFVGQTKENYFYTDGYNRYNRFTFRAKSNIAEKQIAEKSNLYKIYDCGSYIYNFDVATI